MNTGKTSRLAIVGCLLMISGGTLADTLSDGSDGPLTPGGNITLDIPEDGVFNFTTINIPPGVTVTFNRNGANLPPVLLATTDVIIDGTIRVSAGGVTGGPGGGDGGAAGTDAGVAGGDGHGFAGGGGGPGGAPNPGNAGGGGGMATPGLRAIRHTGPFPAPGGPAIAFRLPLDAGSGGGGGGGWQLFGVPLGGGPGGGAGGGVSLCSPVSISITGAILGNGAQGGTGFANAFGHGGPGGGGSGGAIGLDAPAVTLAPGALLHVVPGLGGGLSTIPVFNPDFPSGATGGLGYVSIVASTALIEGDIEGVLLLQTDCAPDIAMPFGALDFFDILRFLELFAVQHPLADVAPPLGVYDFFDVLEYLSRFAAGCVE